ncbi:MAG: UDP-N-acetylmuramoyl-L-alanine--D-glutamate ligase [Paraglaciecola sp.]|nr:UDP-N-acetylmuramoyl-L-alanine--D-glutamate ligase [Paraglaciecola sp.]NCT47226.1 UDP-N-acetylmuramoyl-L-alanine--D-glutamate ligase [Paraglaciecola sp.]
MQGMVLADKKVVVVGMGLTGLSCVQFLSQQGAQVSAMDSRKELTLALDIPLYFGDFDAARLCHADLIVVSPGVSLQHPAIVEASAAGVSVIGDIELFARFNTLPVIAITGSNGKSTVTHLVVQMCQAAGMRVLMGGNIGVPALDLLNQDADIVVLELSSFQLETTYSLRPLAATVLNICDDHLDRHGSLENYQKIKQSIYHHAQHIVVNRDDPLTHLAGRVADASFGLSPSHEQFSWDKTSASIYYQGTALLAAQDCLLVGAHNMLNIMAAAALVRFAGVDRQAMCEGGSRFGGLPHRCQTVSMFKQVRWINDSKATNVGATLAALEGIIDACAGQLILIAGGEGKGADFSPLASLLNNAVSVLITLGKDGEKIAALKTGAIKVTSLQEAVSVAAQHAQANDTVLLSPACSSLDMFNNYMHRGECFAQAVEALAS